ncbi:MAG TPA: potassium-transporting ATPase subunit KdpA, partial [Gemmatimonadales bacterium]|nr:potassium-transporting ATPase subunit KdpA [Gemmatimonadales bacterium]
MTVSGWLQIAFYSVALLLITKPLGIYVLRVYEGSLTWPRPVERLLYRAAGVDPSEDQHWTRYTASMLIFSAVSMLLTYAALRLQHLLPLNPQGFAAVSDRQAFETAASFTTNTNWQSYSGETTMSYFSQMTQLAFHNFMSAGVGVAVAVALARGIVRRTAGRLGNFWADLVRGTLYLFLPLSALLALLFVQQGVIQNFAHYVTVTTVEGAKQILAMGPVASQEAIKQLGTNGGGFFNANAAHPFENPTALSNFVQMISIFAIGAALTNVFGRMVGNQRQGWAILGAMGVLFIAGVFVCYWAEAHGNDAFTAMGL